MQNWSQKQPRFIFSSNLINIQDYKTNAVWDQKNYRALFIVWLCRNFMQQKYIYVYFTSTLKIKLYLGNTTISEAAGKLPKIKDVKDTKKSFTQ